MSFLFHLLGFVVLISGLAWIATAIGVSQTYVMGAALVLFAAGVISGVVRARVTA
jgi:hypothetical protein